MVWAVAGTALGYILLYPFFGFLTLPLRWRNGHVPARKVAILRRT
jgi:hypothetical protein